MRLTDPDCGAKLVREEADPSSPWVHKLEGFPPEKAQGVLFHPLGPGTGGILVWFERALDGGAPASPEARPLVRWAATGTGLHDLTLSPSVDAVGLWHGWIRSGEVVTC